MSLHHWRTPLYSHERAIPSRSSYVTAGEKPAFTVLTAELEHTQCDIGVGDSNDELFCLSCQDRNSEVHNASDYSSNSPLPMHIYSDKREIGHEIPSSDFDGALPLPSLDFTVPASHLQGFEHTVERSMQVTPIDYSSALSFPAGIGLEVDAVFVTADPFKFDYEHDKTPLGLQMADSDSTTSTNSTAHSSTASDDTSSPSKRGMSRATRIQSSLDILRAGRISPVEFLTEVLDVTNPKSAPFRGKLYSKTNKRLDDLLNKIVEDPMGEVMIEDWYRRYSSRKRDSTSLSSCGKENVLPYTGSQYYR